MTESPSSSTSESGSSATPAPKPPEPMSLAEACFSIFFAPSRVFAERENRDWVLPLCIVTMLVALIFFGARPYMQPAIDAETTRQMAVTVRANPQLTPAQIDAARSMGEKFALVGIVVSTPLVVASIAILMWIIGRVVESKQSLKAAFVVATFAYFPRILSGLAGGLIGIARDPAHLTGLYSVTAGPGFFLDASTTSLAVIALLVRLDVFTVWLTVLLAIGLHVTGKVPKGQAYVVAAVIWIIGALPGLFNALRATAG